MFFDLGADKSIIDGALGRKSLGARAVAEGVVLCTGASYHMSMERVVADTANIYRIMNLPKAETLPPEAEDGLEKCLKEHGEALAPGALTDSMVVPLLRSGVLRIIDLEDLPLRRDFAFVHVEAEPSALVRQFIEFARADR